MLVIGAGRPASGQPEPGQPESTTCRVVHLDMTPAADLQIVVWIEDAAEQYVDTVFITRLTGTYGLGNRPGMMEFDSAWRWPYGRRTTTFPVWAHRHGMQWPLVIFQDMDDRDLSHSMSDSSIDPFYCRPLRVSDTSWDTMTCASPSYTDKGMLSETEVSRYPPRSDLTIVPGVDHPSMEMFAALNPFDAISRPTPLGGESFQVSWQIPQDLPVGDYVAWVEVNKEFDQNEFYAYTEPEGIPWSDYGAAYRGQPSVVYKVPFTITDDTEMVVSTAEYAGYGDPDGMDGELRIPDATITTGVPGSGASRLLLTVDGDDMYRLRARALPVVVDLEMPGTPDQMQVLETASTGATASVTGTFIAPGDDDDIGRVAGYEVRYLAGEPITTESFTRAVPAVMKPQLIPEEPGALQTFTIDELRPRLDYSIGIRAYDECGNYGGLGVLQVLTPERASGTVDACFVATAAYGSLMEADVATLRRFRDRFLRTHVTGELLVEGYYTFGPALARIIGPSDTLRRAARAGLAPLVEALGQVAPR